VFVLLQPMIPQSIFVISRLSVAQMTLSTLWQPVQNAT
jgi:hypothetical protein